MKISGCIVSGHSDAGIIAGALSPDNLLSMKTTAEKDDVLCAIEGDKLRSVIASVDDYLANLSIAEDICNILDNIGDSADKTGKIEKTEVN